MSAQLQAFLKLVAFSCPSFVWFCGRIVIIYIILCITVALTWIVLEPSC